MRWLPLDAILSPVNVRQIDAREDQGMAVRNDPSPRQRETRPLLSKPMTAVETQAGRLAFTPGLASP
jgi:hypothetical protein